MTEALDCRSCGACCIEAGVVEVQPAETQVPRYLTRSVRGRMGFASFEADNGVRMMGEHMGGRCLALVGEPCVSVRCKIYDRRPSACSSFIPGSDSCLAAREAAAAKLKHIDSKPRGYGPEWAVHSPIRSEGA